MKQYNILLATDYSDAVMNAERYAVQFAKETNSRITLLHIYPVHVAYPAQSLEYVKNTDENKIYQGELKQLIERRDELFSSLNVNKEQVFSQCIVTEGNNVGKTIREAADENNADFIIVGTHGVSGFREAFLGSESWDVIRKSKVPVIAVPKEAMFTGIKNIVFGTAYREEEFPVIDFLIDFAKSSEAQVTVLHVTNYILSKAFETEMFETFKSDVQKRFTYPKLEVQLMVNDVVDEGINLYCDLHKADLLAMSVPEPTLFEKIFLPTLSMTRKMSFNTNTPLLAVPISYNPERKAKPVNTNAKEIK